MEVAKKWYEHVPGKVRESEKVKILWDFSIQTDHQFEHNRPDLVEVVKQQAVCRIIDVAIPGDVRVELKEKEKVDKYQDLARELRKLRKVKIRVAPNVIGALGTIPKGLVGHLESIVVNLYVAQIQKTALLGTARILRRVLGY